jgi:DNA-binding SARP family transcriptional activator
MLEFRLLGALELRTAEQAAVPLGHPRQQCVLATLLLELNHPVPTDQLLHRVWGEEAASSTQKSLYSYISRLRGALSPHGIRIARGSGGYALAADRASVDLYRFRLLVRQAEKSADDSTARQLLEQGLALWHGDPLAGLHSPWLDNVREQLEAERWAAELNHADAMLREGRHGECLPALLARTAAHPWDERLAGQLMLALYRDGRPADALRNYEDVRHRLAEELGIDPGPSLRKLHQQILVADPELTSPARATPVTPGVLEDDAVPLPRQLPAPPPMFTGRAVELAALDKMFAPQAETAPIAVPLAMICGTGGVGKTSLALRWAHDQQMRYPDGQLYADLRGFTPSGEPTDPYAVVRGFLEALGADPRGLPATAQAQAATYRSLTAGRRLLVVLDNARDTDQVVPLLPGSPSCTVLVTSRHQLPGLAACHGAGQVTLESLDDTEAHELLVRRLGADRVADEPAAAAELLRHCAGLPLALGVLAARVTTNPVLTLAALAAELRDAATRLDALETGEETGDVRAVLASSYLALDADSARVFRQLAQAPGADIGLPAAASLTALPPARLRTRIRRLQAHHLVREHVPGRFTYHDLLRAYALELAETAAPLAEAEAALTRVIDHYAHTAYAADRLLLPHRDPLRPAPPAAGTRPESFASHEAAMAWFTNEHTVLAPTVDHAERTGHSAQAWQLAWAVSTYQTRQGHWADVIGTQTTALAAAVRLGDPTARAESHRVLGWAFTETSRFAEAEHELTRGLALAESDGDLRSAAHTRIALGWLSERQGDRTAALRHDQRAVDLFTSLGNLLGRSRALNAVAWDHAQLGDHTASVRNSQEALALQIELGDERGQADTWDTLGYAQHQLGAHAEAIDCYEHSLALNRALGHRYNEGQALAHLGQAHRATGASGPAGEALKLALQCFLDIKAPASEVDRVRALLREL